MGGLAFVAMEKAEGLIVAASGRVRASELLFFVRKKSVVPKFHMTLTPLNRPATSSGNFACGHFDDFDFS